MNASIYRDFAWLSQAAMNRLDLASQGDRIFFRLKD
jgi:hypothetical protein